LFGQVTRVLEARAISRRPDFQPADERCVAAYFGGFEVNRLVKLNRARPGGFDAFQFEPDR
jgi:hypothetical protein